LLTFEKLNTASLSQQVGKKHQGMLSLLTPPMLWGLFKKNSRLPSAASAYDGNDDRLDMLVAPTFARRQLPNFRERFDEGRVVSVVVKPLQGIRHGSYKNIP
jgi:hypothetical protein